MIEKETFLISKTKGHLSHENLTYIILILNKIKNRIKSNKSTKKKTRNMVVNIRNIFQNLHQ